MELMPKDILRIIDANLNRAGEGLRVLEEFARMSLNDEALTRQLKDMRHSILVMDGQLQERIVQARDAAGDIGSEMTVEGQDKQQDASAIVIANARRVQESLRVLEELAKAYDTGLETDIYKKIRFDLYTIEQELLAKLRRREKLDRLKGLYVIIDTASLQGIDHAAAAEQAIKGGAKVIQLRDKVHLKGELIDIARKVKDICRDNNVLFIVNDYLDVTLAADADGLHLGERDLPPDIARQLLPADKILGCSARTVERAQAVITAGADHLGVGGMYPTKSKESNEVIGIEGLKAIRKSVDVPIVAIGGINIDNVAEVMASGADAVAVINAVLGSADIERAAGQLVKIIEGGNYG